MGFNSGFKGLNDKVTSLFSYIDLHIQSIFHHQFFFRASRYIRVMKTNLLHYLSSVYFVSQPLHVSGISVAHRQGLYYIYIYIYTHNNWYVLCFSVDCLLVNLVNRQSTEKHNTYQLLYIYSMPPDNGLQICPKHVEVDWRSKLRINSASSWFLLQDSSLFLYLNYVVLLNPHLRKRC